MLKNFALSFLAGPESSYPFNRSSIVHVLDPVSLRLAPLWNQRHPFASSSEIFTDGLKDKSFYFHKCYYLLY